MGTYLKKKKSNYCETHLRDFLGNAKMGMMFIVFQSSGTFFSYWSLSKLLMISASHFSNFGCSPSGCMNLCVFADVHTPPSLENATYSL